MAKDNELRAGILAAIAVGWIPDRRPDHLWGSRASRGYCGACRAAMKMGEVALEIQFLEEGGARTVAHDVHVRCYVALEDEWDRREAAGCAQRSAGPAAAHIVLVQQDRSS